MDKQQQRIRSMTIDAMFLAVIIIMATVPYLGFINLGVISITLIHLNIFLGAYIGGWKKGLLYGFFFGMVSFARAFSASAPFDLFFMNPLISILPRVLFGLVSGIVIEKIRKIDSSKKQNCYLAVAVVFLTIFHSFITLLAIVVLKGGVIVNSQQFTYPSIWHWLGIIILTNGLGEALAAGMIIVPLTHALKNKLSVKDI